MVNEISVIICAYTEQRWEELASAVESVQNQSLLPREIIVVIDHNPALFRRAQERFLGVTILENKGSKGLSGARNTGWTTAQSEIIAFLDDDAIAAPDWLENLTTCYAEQDVVGVGGKIVPLWEIPRPAWFPSEFYWVVGCTYRGMPTANAPVRNPIGANMSIRRAALAEVEGFCESFGWERDKDISREKLKWLKPSLGDEETELCIRISQQLPEARWLYVPSAVVQHRVPVLRVRRAYFLWRCYGEGLGKASLVKRHNTSTGLSSERTYTLKTLPQGVIRGLADPFFRRDMGGILRAGAIVSGLAATIFGYLVGCLCTRLPASNGVDAQQTRGMYKEIVEARQ